MAKYASMNDLCILFYGILYKTINVRQTYLYAFAMEPKDLRILNGQLEAVNRRRIFN
jgi:hypothetical protein